MSPWKIGHGPGEGGNEGRESNVGSALDRYNEMFESYRGQIEVAGKNISKVPKKVINSSVREFCSNYSDPLLQEQKKNEAFDYMNYLTESVGFPSSKRSEQKEATNKLLPKGFGINSIGNSAQEMVRKVSFNKRLSYISSLPQDKQTEIIGKGAYKGTQAQNDKLFLFLKEIDAGTQEKIDMYNYFQRPSATNYTTKKVDLLSGKYDLKHNPYVAPSEFTPEYMRNPAANKLRFKDLEKQIDEKVAKEEAEYLRTRFKPKSFKLEDIGKSPASMVQNVGLSKRKEYITSLPASLREEIIGKGGEYKGSLNQNIALFKFLKKSNLDELDVTKMVETAYDMVHSISFKDRNRFIATLPNKIQKEIIGEEGSYKGDVAQNIALHKVVSNSSYLKKKLSEFLRPKAELAPEDGNYFTRTLESIRENKRTLGNIDWNKHAEFRNDVSERFMQSLLDNREKLQKELNIPDDLYKDLAAFSFSILQMEGGGGDLYDDMGFNKTFMEKKLTGLMSKAESLKNDREFIGQIKVAQATNPLFSPLIGKVAQKMLRNHSFGFTQIQLNGQGAETKALFKKFGINKPADLWDPEKSAVATLILLKQQNKYDMPRFRKKNPKLSNLDLMGYTYYKPGELVRGTATPGTNRRIIDANNFYQIGRDMIDFPEETTTLMGNVEWRDYEGKNNYFPTGTVTPAKGCASFLINENREFTDDGVKYPINGDAWKMAHEIIYTGGWEIDSICDDLKLDKSIITSEVKAGMLEMKLNPDTKPTSAVIDAKRKANQSIQEHIRNKEIDTSNLRVGDIVNIYYPYSKVTLDAYETAIKYRDTRRKSTPNTHVGQITEHDGKLFVTHNLYGVVHSDPLEEMVKGDNSHQFKIIAAYRPNSEYARAHIQGLKVEQKKKGITPLSYTYKQKQKTEKKVIKSDFEYSPFSPEWGLESSIEKGFVTVKCTTAEALEIEKSPQLFDGKGQRIIYRITDTKKFSSKLSLNPENRDKKYVAFHGTGYELKGGEWASDYRVTQSALNTLSQSADAAFLIGKSGAIYQFFDADLGQGALNTKLCKSNGLGNNFNRDAIGIELALRAKKWEFGVEEPNNAQIKAGQYLGLLLGKQYKIPQNNFLTSKDPVRGIWGAHGDDFSDKIRLQLGIPTMIQNKERIANLKKEKLD